jgi:hypothetical protein
MATKPIIPEGYVHGFAISHRDGCETLYARHADDSLTRTGPHASSCFFGALGRRWETVGAIPEGAEFIGTYHAEGCNADSPQPR